MADVLLATCSEHPDGDEDGAQILTALAGVGVAGRWCEWDDPAVDWAAAPVVLRSTWDYTLRREQFLRWAEQVPVLFNPADIVRWNSDKTYLRDLAEAGVPVVATAWAAPGEQVVLPDAGEFVVKPSVGAGSRGAGRFDAAAHDAARVHAATLHDDGRTVMVQPYLADVDTAGETALVYLRGGFSHAVRKGPMLPPGTAHGVRSHSLYVAENITPRAPSDAQLDVGAQAHAALRARYGAEPLYARVDLLPTPTGPVIVELELVEPSLFLAFSDGGVERFAAAVASRLRHA